MAAAKRKQPARHAHGWQHYAAPAGFLVAATIAVLLVRGAFEQAASTGAPTATVATAAGTTTAPQRTTTSAPTTTARAGGAAYHEVEAGDTFGAIASRYDTTVERLEALNPGVSSTSLHIGQRIRVR